MVINDPSSRISNSTTSSNSHGISPRDSDTKMIVIPETEVHAYHSQIEQMTRKLEKTSIDLAISQEQNKYLESQLDPRGDVSGTTTANQQVTSKEQSSLQQDKPTNPPADWRLVLQEMDHGNGDLMICMPMVDETETMMKNVFTHLISMLHQRSLEEEETKPFCTILVPNAAVSKCLFTKHFQDKRVNTIYTNDDGTPIWAWETHNYPTVGLLTCQCFFTEVDFGRLKLDNIRFFMMQGVDSLVNDPDFVNCLMQLKAINTTINYRMLAFSSSMDTHLKRMMPKILRPGYKQMIFDSVDVVTNAQPNHPKAVLSDQPNSISSLLGRIEFDEEPLASSADASPRHRPAQVHDEQVELPRSQQDLWSEEGEEEEDDDNDIGLPRPGQQKQQLILKQEAESSQKKKMPKFSIWNHAAGANGQSGSEPSARSLQPSNSAAASEATGNGGDGGGGDTGKGNKNNGSAARFERPLRLTSQHSTGIFYPI